MEEQIATLIPIYVLVIVLICLILASAFFSSSETAMMAINRYRLKHAAKTNPTARRIIQLLSRPDRLLTIVLIGNSFANIASGSIGTIIGLRLYGEIGGLVATGILGVMILLFAEISPKIVASQKPEFVSYLAATPLHWLIKLFFPLVWSANALSNGLLRLMGVKHNKKTLDILTLDELRTMVTESASILPGHHKSMLTSILDLEHITVNDIMIQRADILGIDLDDDEATILSKIRSAQHTLLPIYRGDIDDIYGIVHMRDLSKFLTEQKFNKALLVTLSEKPYFVPEGTPLHTQLFNFQHKKTRLGLVVDEYGDIVGLVTLADILEEIVGEFTTDITNATRVIPQADNSYLVDGSTNIRTLNNTMHWDLPTYHAKTISGAIIEYLEMIPTRNTCVCLNGYPIEIIIVKGNMIKTCKIGPKIT